MEDLQWYPEQPNFIFAIIALTVGFCIYWFVAKSPGVKKWMVKKYGAEMALANIIFFQKLTGVLFLFLLPAIAAYALLGKTPADYGFSYNPETFWEGIWWTIGLVALIWIINFFNSKRAESLRMYPQIRKKEWTPRIFWLNGLLWCAYLFSYEYLFRGVFLFECLEYLSVWEAIAINISLYMVAHLPKGITETFGSIPMGLILCLLAIELGTIWPGCIIHFFLSWSAEVWSLYRQPEMRLVKA